MGFWSSVVSVASSAFSAVTSAIATGLSSAINTLVTKGLEVVSRVASVVGDVLKALGILKPEDDMKDFGDKAIQAVEHGITPDKYDEYDEYVEAIRNFDKLDPEISAKTSTEVKLSVAVGVGLNSLEKKLEMPEGSSGDLLRLVILSPDYFNSDRLQSLLDKKVDFDKVTDYFSGKLDLADSRQVRSELFSAEKSLDGTADEAKHTQDLSNLKEQAREQGV